MPQEDIHTVCRIRPLTVDGKITDLSRQKPRADCKTARCVRVDEKSCNQRVIYTHQLTEKKNIARKNSRQGPKANDLDDTALAFDYVAGEGESQADLYHKVGFPVVNSCLQGYNGTILCYGQTSSG